jgi:HTH-type transcriptional regulator/antitoxin HigA
MTNATYTSDVPPPGHFIKEELEARGWAQRDLAYVLGTTEQDLTRLLSGKQGISPKVAKALGHAFDVNPELFVNLQTAYDLANAPEPNPAVARRARLQSAYPVREMIKRGWLEDAEPSLLEAQMARFFKVANANEIPYMAHAAKKTEYEIDASPAQLAWLFRVRQMAESMGAARYSEKALREALPKLRNLMAAPEEVRQVPRVLAECGVRFIVSEVLPNSKIDGVCFWLNSHSPVVGMSTRYDRIDNFWFVLRHELEHVLCRHGGNTLTVIDAELEGDRAGEGAGVPEEERVANAAAADFCVPRHEMASFFARKAPFFAERDVVGFARRLRIHPGLVVGQIQARTGRWDFLRKYLVKIRQFLLPGAMVDGWGQVAPVTI